VSKKRDFIQSQQSRDKHPDSGMKGSASDVMQQGLKGMNRSTASADRQAPHSGKLANDHNKQGEQTPTQKNEGRRTPQSRHERQTRAGGPQNVIEARTGGKGGGRSPRGAG
jgi:hypothetical protein